MTVDINSHKFTLHDIISYDPAEEYGNVTFRVEAVEGDQLFLRVVNSKNPDVKLNAVIRVPQDRLASPKMVEVVAVKNTLDEKLSPDALIDVIAYKLQIWLSDVRTKDPKKNTSYNVLIRGLREANIVEPGVSDATLKRYFKRIFKRDPTKYRVSGGWVRMLDNHGVSSAPMPNSSGVVTRKINKRKFVEALTTFAIAMVECGFIDATWEIE